MICRSVTFTVTAVATPTSQCIAPPGALGIQSTYFVRPSDEDETVLEAQMKPHPLTRHSISSVELKLPSGKSVGIPKCSQLFIRWTGTPITDTYGGKDVLNFDAEPVFAELAILGTLQEGGWDGVWVDTFRRKFRPAMPPACCDLPAHAQELYDRICRANDGNFAGWFDVFAWKGQDYLFVESKRKYKDSIRETQRAWIEAALDSGVSVDSLLICEWDFGWIDRSRDPLETKEDVEELFRMVEKLREDSSERKD